LGNIGLGELIIIGVIGLMILGGATLVVVLVINSQKPPPS
jgi:hypothetical protein